MGRSEVACVCGVGYVHRHVARGVEGLVWVWQLERSEWRIGDGDYRKLCV